LSNYRLYRLDGAGKITSAEWLEADDDEHAARQAQQRALDGPYEVWQRNRLIARIGGEGR
jgi:hypothetical protein